MKLAAALCISIALHSAAFAQCNNNLGTKTYDTTLTSNGLAFFNLTFPKWNPDSGLLVSAKLAAEVTSQYSFNLRNADVQPSTYQLTLGQQDQFTSTALLAPFTSITNPKLIGSYPLDPGASIAQGPFTFLNKNIASDSITAVGGFLGSGAISISYLSFTFTSLSTYNNASYYYGATIANNMRFSLQYLYCKSSVILAADITRWTASLKDAHTAQLEWSVTNEAAGRQYHIQRSTDGKSFSDIAAIPANASQNYSYPDLLPGGLTGNIFYRLQFDDNGTLTYSAVKEISLSADPQKIKIYPNPATDYINIIPASTMGNDWQIDILSANGSLIQRETYLQVRNIHLAFRNKMSAGTYFVRALDLRGQKTFTSSFIVTGGN